VAFALVNGVLMPAFADGQTSTTFRRVYGGLGGTPGAAARHVAEHPLSTLGTMFQHAKVHLLLLLFGAFALLPLLSPVTLIAVPGIAERLLAGPPQYYLPQYHYTLLVASLLAMAAADGLARLRRWLPARWGESVALGLTGAALMISVGNSVTSPPLDIFKPSSYRRTAFDRAADAAVARVPDGAAVGASIPLLARVSAREHVYSVEAGKRRAQWLLLSGPEVAAEVPAGWTMVYARKGVALLRATSVGGAAQLGALDLPAGGLG
jgi:hypothetical protein